MKRTLTRLLVGRMSMRKRYLSVSAGVVLALLVVFASLTFSVESDAVAPGNLKYYEFEDKDGYCDDEDEAPCDKLMACRDECEEGDYCCPDTVTEEVTPICLWGCG